MTRSGKQWSEHEEGQDKLIIARLVEAQPADAVHPERMPVIQTIVSAIESYIKVVTV